MELTELNAYPAIKRVVASFSDEIVRDSYIFENIRTRNLNGTNYKLQLINEAMGNLENIGQVGWALDKFKRLFYERNSIEVKSLCAAEIVAAGLISSCFSGLKPNPESKNIKQPDFVLGSKTLLEVYCPQIAEGEIESLKEKFSLQQGSVKWAIFHPITGSKGQSLTYPANQVVARLVRGKGSNGKDQTKVGKENILWLDLVNGITLSGRDLLPCRSSIKGDIAFIECIGAWHAFYGKKDDSVFPYTRSVLKGHSASNIYLQKKCDGLFRDRASLSAAVFLVNDGIVLYENPWALIPLSDDTKYKLSRLPRFRPEFSVYSGGARLKEDVIDDELIRLKWLLNA